MAAPRILIVEGEPLLADDLARSVKSLGYEVCGTASAGERAMKAAETTSPDLVLMDIELSGKWDGIEAADAIRKRLDVPVVYLTGYAEQDILERATKTEPYGYLAKPVSLLELRTTVETALYKHAADKRGRESEAKYRSLVEQIPAITYTAALDQASTTLYMSPQVKLLLGFSQAEYEADPDIWRKSLHPEDRDRVLAEVSECHKTGAAFFSEYRMIGKDGRTIWFQDRAQPVSDSIGRPVCLQGAMLDITTRKTAEEALLKSEQRFRNLIDQAADAIFVHDFEGRFLEVNRSACTALGYERDELLAMSVSDVDPDAMPRRDSESLWPNLPVAFEATHRRKDGSTLPVEVRLGPIEFAGTRVVLALARDVSERKQAEDTLRENEERFRTLFETMAIGVVVHNAQGEVIALNPATERILGLPSEQHPGKCSPDLRRQAIREDGSHFPDDEHPAVVALRTGEPQPRTLMGVFDPEKRDCVWVDVDAVPYFRPGEDKPYQIYTTLDDVTERRLSKLALLDKTTELEEILNAIPDAVVYADKKRNISKVNPAFSRIFGYQPDEVVGRGTRILYTNEESFLEQGQRRFNPDARKVSEPYEIAYQRKDGSRFTSETVGTPVRNAKDELVGLLGIMRDISDRKKAEQALQDKEYRYRTLVETMNDGLVILDESGKIIHVNRAFCHMLGYPADEPLGLRAFELIHEDYSDVARRGFADRRQGLSATYELVLVGKDGRDVAVILSATPMQDSQGSFTGAFGVVTDITDRKKAEKKVKNSLKEKEVLLREIHHRVKNNLAIINSLLRLQSKYVADERLTQEFLATQARIRSMAVAHELVYQSESLAYVKAGKYIISLLDQLVTYGSDLETRVSVKREIDDVSFGLDTAIPLGFIITELVSNCVKHAFPGRTEGDITVSLRSPDGEEFELLVKDDGVGMPDETDRKTKKSLGLSLVDTFVTQLGGEMQMETDGGTEVRIRFRGGERGEA
ncbi:PAS domain S-box protein [Thermodesulfobacteriota bacterium]